LTRSTVDDANYCRLGKHREPLTSSISRSDIFMLSGQENGGKKQGDGRNDHKSAHTENSSGTRIIQRESDGTFY
jgi:hypothetical protein